MSTTMKAAIRLEPNFTENVDVNRNSNFEELQNLFIRYHGEIDIGPPS